MGIVDQVTCSEVKLALFLQDASHLELPSGVLIWAARALRVSATHMLLPPFWESPLCTVTPAKGVQ